MEPFGGLSPRHRLPFDLPGPWPSCAQALLREGGCWLHAGGPGGWGGNLLARPGGPLVEARWDGTTFQGSDPWGRLERATKRATHPFVGAATFELACWEAGLPFRAPAPGTLGMRWTGVREALWEAAGQAELWGWGEQPPDPEAWRAELAQACTLGRPALGAAVPAWSREAHGQAVARIQARILDGGFYVANLCVPFEAPFSGDPVTWALARFRAARPPFAAFLPLGEVTLVSLSMERVLAREGTRLWAEPIKGSAPLGPDAPGTEALGRALEADPKEVAEHTMIVDLVRNDLGRVSESGTVRVAALRERRPYPTVQHLVSRVEGRLAPSQGLASLLRSVLPGGSVTGAPKHAVCTHLAQAEAGPRGFYCGALGWIGPGGAHLDLALPIRTAQLRGDRLEYWAGGGITRRSDPAREWEELWLKTRVLQ